MEINSLNDPNLGEVYAFSLAHLQILTWNKKYAGKQIEKTKIRKFYFFPVAWPYEEVKSFKNK